MLTTETGSGLQNAESYASVAAADARCAALGVTDWSALTEGAKEVALRKAAIFMLANYRTRWAGRRCTQTQALDWPRYDVVVDCWTVASNSVPAEVVNACIDLAARAGRGEELMPDTGQSVKKKKVGPIEIEYAQGSDVAKDRPAIDAMLEPYFGVAGGSGQIKLVRG